MHLGITMLTMKEIGWVLYWNAVLSAKFCNLKLLQNKIFIKKLMLFYIKFQMSVNQNVSLYKKTIKRQREVISKLVTDEELVSIILVRERNNKKE